MSGEGLSGHAIPKQYGQVAPFFRLTRNYVLPSMILAAAMVFGGIHECASVRSGRVALGAGAGTKACKILSQLGAAFAFGSNVWLLRYGPKMFKVCTTEASWLGKEAFSTIQASLFPEYFALQAASCVVALGGHVGVLMADPFHAGVVGLTLDLESWAMLLAVVFALVNLLGLGPKTTELMVALYESNLVVESCELGGGDQPLLVADAKKVRKKRFGMVHGISMLFDLFNLVAVTIYLACSSLSHGM